MWNSGKIKIQSWFSHNLPLYDIPTASKGIIFEGFSWQGENFLNMCMHISIMIHKEVGTWQTKE